MVKPHFYRDASDRLCFDLFRIAATEYPAICRAIADEFALMPASESFAAGLDVVLMDLRRGGQVVELSWDNWAGFIVTAKSPDSESLIEEVAKWLLCSRWAQGGPA